MSTPSAPSSRSRKTARNRAETALWTLLQSLEKVKTDLSLSYRGFHQSLDPDLIQYYLFEIDALHAKYNYLLRQIKSITLGASADSAPPLPFHPDAHY